MCSLELLFSARQISGALAAPPRLPARCQPLQHSVPGSFINSSQQAKGQRETLRLPSETTGGVLSECGGLGHLRFPRLGETPDSAGADPWKRSPDAGEVGGVSGREHYPYGCEAGAGPCGCGGTLWEHPSEHEPLERTAS